MPVPQQPRLLTRALALAQEIAAASTELMALLDRDTIDGRSGRLEPTARKGYKPKKKAAARKTVARKR